MNKSEYSEYLENQHWKGIRAIKLRSMPWIGPTVRCERCGLFVFHQFVNVHHKHYKTLWHERNKDLEVLCEQCHATTHGTDVSAIRFSHRTRSAPRQNRFRNYEDAFADYGGSHQ